MARRASSPVRSPSRRSPVLLLSMTEDQYAELTWLATKRNTQVQTVAGELLSVALRVQMEAIGAAMQTSPASRDQP